MRRFRITVAGAIVLGLASAAMGDPVTITSDRRLTSVLGNAILGGTNINDAQNALHFAGDALSSAIDVHVTGTSGSSAATLFSDISNPLRLSATGNATASASSSGPTAIGNTVGTLGESDFTVLFSLPGFFTYQFIGTFASTGNQSVLAPNGSLDSRAIWQAGLSTGSTSLFFTREESPGTLARTGVLGPGTYGLLVDTGASAGVVHLAGSRSARSGFEMTFTLDPLEVPPPSPSPEPASMLLLATGLMGLAARTRMDSLKDAR